MNVFLNEYFGFCFELNFELNHFSDRFNEKMNFQNVSPRATEDPLNAWKVILTHCQAAQGHFSGRLDRL